MILFTLFAVFSAVFLLWRKARLAIAAAAALLAWLLAAGWLSAPLLEAVQRQAPDTEAPAFAPRTVIVMLGSGTEYDGEQLVPKRDALARIAKTAALYERCKNTVPRKRCTVIVSGGNPQRHDTSEAENYAPYLRRRRVEPLDLLLEPTSRNTYENARNVARMLPHHSFDTLILVTSAYHMPRALLDFHRFGLAPQPVIANARTVERGLLPRPSNLVSADIALHELIGIAQFHVYRVLGWF